LLRLVRARCVVSGRHVHSRGGSRVWSGVVFPSSACTRVGLSELGHPTMPFRMDLAHVRRWFAARVGAWSLSGLSWPVAWSPGSGPGWGEVLRACSLSRVRASSPVWGRGPCRPGSCVAAAGRPWAEVACAFRGSQRLQYLCVEWSLWSGQFISGLLSPPPLSSLSPPSLVALLPLSRAVPRLWCRPACSASAGGRP
jgi:hypothetical protein